MLREVTTLEGLVSVVSDTESKSFVSYPYITLIPPQGSTENVTYEVYLYDITGEDASKFNSFTFEQLKSGTISVYEE